MQTRPPDLSDAVLTAAVSAGWGLRVARADYRPTGSGSHHWKIRDAAGDRWFASVVPLGAAEPDARLGRLREGLSLAGAARESGLSFVVPAVRRVDGEVVSRLAGGYALALQPFAEGRPGRFCDDLEPGDSTRLVEMLCALHSVPVPAERVAARVGVEPAAVAGPDQLEAALADLGDAESWSGPYGSRLRSQLTRYATAICHGAGEHFRLVAATRVPARRLVLTHGAPHPGNLIRTPGGLVLVDWDNARPAAPERDLWLADARTGGRASAEYTARSGRPLDRDLLAAYRLGWSLADVAAFVAQLKGADTETADTEWAWEALRETLAELATGFPARQH